MKTDDDMFIDLYETYTFTRKYLNTKEYKVMWILNIPIPFHLNMKPLEGAALSSTNVQNLYLYTKKSKKKFISSPTFTE